MGPRNRFQGMNSARLCSLAGRYNNPIPTRCLAPIDFLKIPAQDTVSEDRYPLIHLGPQRRSVTYNCLKKKMMLYEVNIYLELRYTEHPALEWLTSIPIHKNAH
jgi:hypothetical protein